MTRAFCLGTLHSDDSSWQPSDNEIDGPGYLAVDTAFFRDLPEEAYASVSWLAGKRLALQSAYQMADAPTLAFDRKSSTIATNAAAHAAETPYLDQQQEYGAALSYQILNHPVIRGTVSEAVAGILWYLGLLVPFAFFFEKLAFGFADIRRRLLVQGAGRILASLGVTAGLDMNFASLTSVYASLAIAAATLLSTWYPARTAMEIAKPADNAGWSLPAPDADGRLSTLLPFTFTHQDRIAVLAFLHDYFDSLGEGSSGIFFSGRPEQRLSDRLDDLADNAYIPELKVRVWLKPFDLGVSQDVEIELGTDPETREYIARMTITRLTGTLESWYRLNKPFVTAVRRQFLHWRAVGDAQKSALFAKAKALMNG